MDNKIRILLVDDHPAILQGLSTIFGLQSNIEVVGKASDGKAAIHLAKTLLPDVILMDVNMPHMNGIEATRIIHSDFPQIRIIGMSMYDDNTQIVAMIDAGALVFYSKGTDTALLLSMIRSVSLNKS